VRIGGLRGGFELSAAARRRPKPRMLSSTFMIGVLSPEKGCQNLSG
jgi:hypothetical protein